MTTTTFAPTDERSSALPRVLIAAGALGLVLRVVLAALSIGSDDASIWLEHAHTIRERGLTWALTHKEPGRWHYNHPPMAGYWALLAGKLSQYELYRFALWMKLPALISECAAAALLYRIGRERSRLTATTWFAVYGLSVPLIIVAGYHCNTDAVCAAASLYSVYFLTTRKRPVWAGAAWAFAVNVKLIPLFLLPALLAMCRTRREFVQFGLAAATATLPFLPFVAAEPAALYRNMLGYNSLQLDWGLMAFLNHSNDLPLWSSTLFEVRQFVVKTGRYWVLAGACAIAWFAHRFEMNGYLTAACCWAAFLILTPGFGVQYAVCVVAVLTIADWRRAIVYSGWMGLMLLPVYTLRMVPVFPLHAPVQYFPFPVLAAMAGIMAWSSLVGFVVQSLRRTYQERRAFELDVHRGG